MKKRLRIVLGIVLSTVLLFSGYQIAEMLAGYARSETARQEAMMQVVSIVDEGLPATEQTDASTTAAEATAVPLETPPIAVDFDALREINPEIVGWLYCADTPINYPVAYTDNNAYYLNHLYDGTRNHSGTLFVDCNCSPNFSDMNTVIYGHHMKSGAMFACLVEYEVQAYYEAHPVMYLLTPQHNYRLDIFSGYVAEAGSQRFFMGSGDEAEFEAYLEEIKAISDFNSCDGQSTQNRIVTLSTCTYDFHEARYILHAFLTEIGD